MSGRIPPRPGDRCIYCRQEILENDQWYGGKGDYWHMRCFNVQVQEELENDKQRKMIYASRASDKTWEYTEYDDDSYAVDEFDKYYDEKNQYSKYGDYVRATGDRSYKEGYDKGYEHGKRDGLESAAAQNQTEVDHVRAVLDKVGVPARVSQRQYGVGQAARLAWFLDRQGYVIEEIGNPDALA